MDKEDSSRLTVASSEYVLHPNYNAATLDNDIGLIKLRMKVEFTGEKYLSINLIFSYFWFADFIKPITALAMNSLPDYSYLRAIGWGQTSDSKNRS